MDIYSLLLAAFMGIGLAAACGFRVFVPLLLVSLAAHADYVQLASGLEWIGSTPALICFGMACALEIAGYYVPWVDNLLDTLATPAAGIAGTLLMASMLTGMDPLLHWSLAAIAGGGSALLTQAMTVTARAASSVTTGGLGNPIVSTVETGASLVLTLLIILVPLLAVVIVGLLMIWLIRMFFYRRSASAQATGPQPSTM